MKKVDHSDTSRIKIVGLIWSEWGDSYNFCSHQCSHWCQQYATGILQFDFSNLPTALEKKNRTPPMAVCGFWSEWGDSNSRRLDPKT